MFRIISLGKQAKVLFPITHSLPHVQTHPGDTFYIAGVLSGLILWGFAIVWFVVAVMMIAVSGRFPFDMGWWGFIFPIGECLTLESSLCEWDPSLTVVLSHQASLLSRPSLSAKSSHLTFSRFSLA